MTCDYDEKRRRTINIILLIAIVFLWGLAAFLDQHDYKSAAIGCIIGIAVCICCMRTGEDTTWPV